MPGIHKAAIKLLHFYFFQQSLFYDEVHDLLYALTRAQIGKNKWPFPSHPLSIACHYTEVGADMRRKVDLVDNQQS